MSLKRYLSVMVILTLICWGVLIFVINIIDPNSTNWLGFALFYFSLFLSLVGLTALIGFIIRFIIFRRELVFNLVKNAFRQSFLLSLFLVIALFLKSKLLFNWLNLLLLILVFSGLELILINNKKNKQNLY